MIVAVTLWLTLACVAADDPLMVERLTQLTAPELAGRGAATAGERAAADLVADWLAGAGCRSAFTGSWLQDVPLTDGRTAVNVAGVLPGAGDLADRWLVVGAHLDHLGRVDPASTGLPEPGEYYPGAGDNASGVVAVAAAVACFAADPPARRRSLLVCGFGAEEIGLLGSAHLAAHLPVPAGRVDAMVNLDAVGRLGDGPLNAAGLETSERFGALVAAAADPVAVRGQDTALLQSDHQSFLALGIPSLFLFTGGYAEMNSPHDDLMHLDVAGVATVASVTHRLLRDLATAPGEFTFQAPAPAAAAPATGEGDRRTWFGSVPDFSGEADAGYVLGGVAEGGPAARAGLQRGDVLVSLGGEAVTDLATFTVALRRHAPGDVVEVEVIRAGRSLRSLVTLGDRSQRGR